MIAAQLEDRAACFGERPFLLTDDGTYGYGEIAALVRRCASRLAARGVRAGDRVALAAGNSAAYVVAWFGISALGAIAVTLNTELIGDGVRYVVRHSDATLLIADRRWLDASAASLAGERLPPVETIESEPAFFASLAAEPERAPVDVPAHATCTILYTSGTTGLPKGVMNPHRAYLATGRATAEALALGGTDRIMCFLPLFHVNPQMFALMGTLAAGGSLAIRPRFSARTFFSDAARVGATGCTFVGTVLAILAQRYPDAQREHRLRFCFGGGAALDVWRAVEDRFGMRVYEAYGMTEIGGWTSANTVTTYRFGSCGRPRPEIELRVVDERGRAVPAEVTGEIVARPREPDLILSGYYNRPEELAAALRDGWFHTGDVGRFDTDGFLYFAGRRKELIRRGGEMISPVEIESALRALPGVVDCAVVGVADAIMGEEIKAVLVVERTLQAEAVRAFLAERLAAFMLPRYVEFVTALPKTATAKVQRNQLQYLDERATDLRARRTSRP